MKNKTGLILIAATLLGSSYNASASTEPFLGEIMWVGYSFCPRGWANADGQLLAISQNSALFSLYGTTYGGDGRTTFALPDLRGRVAIHVGRGPGMTDRRLGARAGSEQVTQTAAQMPSHSHAANGLTAELKASQNKGDLAHPESAMLADGQRAAVYGEVPADPDGITTMAEQSISVNGRVENTGGNRSMPNMQPYLVLRACIAMVGTYPSRN
ncbi:phage tail protein [Pelagibaculum spongiae]|uniref:Phage tail protein n=1 Tax=Pelagibaculum spongiae TaxID=2080658 RepID=A0A2V1H056_9GAMM|nr:tail fiber protein [Pelagibaculum spongiae]PVZ72059.1 phage tail protein [Pelagibaculum spongiae]